MITRVTNISLAFTSVCLLLLINLMVRKRKAMKSYQADLISMIFSLEAIYTIVKLESTMSITAGYTACYFEIPWVLKTMSFNMSGNVFDSYANVTTLQS